MSTQKIEKKEEELDAMVNTAKAIESRLKEVEALKPITSEGRKAQDSAKEALCSERTENGVAYNKATAELEVLQIEAASGLDLQTLTG